MTESEDPNSHLGMVLKDFTQYAVGEGKNAKTVIRNSDEWKVYILFTEKIENAFTLSNLLDQSPKVLNGLGSMGNPLKLTPAIMKNLMFQLIWSLICMDQIGLRHNDLHLANILVRRNSEVKYFEIDGKYYELNQDIEIQIFDWDRASMDKTIYNSFLSNANLCQYHYGCNINNTGWDSVRPLVSIYSMIKHMPKIPNQDYQWQEFFMSEIFTPYSQLLNKSIGFDLNYSVLYKTYNLIPSKEMLTKDLFNGKKFLASDLDYQKYKASSQGWYKYQTPFDGERTEIPLNLDLKKFFAEKLATSTFKDMEIKKNKIPSDAKIHVIPTGNTVGEISDIVNQYFSDKVKKLDGEL
jgi:hypothetical protein